MLRTICSVGQKQEQFPLSSRCCASLIASGRMPDHSNQTKADGILRPNQALE